MSRRSTPKRLDEARRAATRTRLMGELRMTEETADAWIAAWEDKAAQVERRCGDRRARSAAAHQLTFTRADSAGIRMVKTAAERRAILDEQLAAAAQRGWQLDLRGRRRFGGTGWPTEFEVVVAYGKPDWRRQLAMTILTLGFWVPWGQGDSRNRQKIAVDETGNVTVEAWPTPRYGDDGS